MAADKFFTPRRIRARPRPLSLVDRRLLNNTGSYRVYLAIGHMQKFARCEKKQPISDQLDERSKIRFDQEFLSIIRDRVQISDTWATAIAKFPRRAYRKPIAPSNFIYFLLPVLFFLRLNWLFCHGHEIIARCEKNNPSFSASVRVYLSFDERAGSLVGGHRPRERFRTPPSVY